ncbi:pyrroline-5-carboxylate reductase [Candidatus Micrarchaeota archaeon]|nr:pyrroline-5-carboxylate reductase [Candidatus Micrarchaeota archaeon]
MRIGIIGTGRLGSVLARAFSRNHEVVVYDKDYEKAKEAGLNAGALATKNIKDFLTFDIVVAAVKPAQVEEVIKQIKDANLIVSPAAGVPISKIEKWGAKNVIRIMPNIAAEVYEAVIAYSLHQESESKEKIFLAAFSALGLCIKTEETQLDPITAASGSGPAFVAFFAKAMMDEAIEQGLNRELARKVVAQTLVGTGKMMLSSWTEDKIISTVASPGGTTEAGLKMLEEKGAKKAICDAIRFATEKARELGK